MAFERSPSRRHRRRIAGFTLVELLVVVAVIAMLLAILMPSLGYARLTARRVACQANLRELAAAWHHYLDANNDRFLQGTNTDVCYGGVQGQGSTLAGSDPNRPVVKPLNRLLRLSPVLREGPLGGVFHCPTDRGSNKIPVGYFDYYGTSYLMNSMLVGPTSFTIEWDDPAYSVLNEVRRRLSTLTRSRIANESKLLLMGDGVWRDQWYWLTRSENLVSWHAKAAHHNMAFMDGHVEFLRIHQGVHTADDYTVIPFKDLQEAAVKCQKEVPTK